MKLAIIADIHGNLHALDAVLDAVERERVDGIICAGDMVTPLPGSLEVWQRLTAQGIPIVRGNREDYMVDYYTSDTCDIRTAPHLTGLRWIAETLSPAIAQDFAALPLQHRVAGPRGDDVVVCHASLSDTLRSYLDGIEDDMRADLETCSASTIVSGHKHVSALRTWNGKRLLFAGSVGLPLHGQPRPEYMLLTHERRTWHVSYRTVAYDYERALKPYVESGCCAYGAPFSWMVYDEVWTGEPRCLAFFAYAREHKCVLDAKTAWEQAIQDYLRSLGRWEILRAVF